MMNDDDYTVFFLAGNACTLSSATNVCIGLNNANMLRGMWVDISIDSSFDPCGHLNAKIESRIGGGA